MCTTRNQWSSCWSWAKRHRINWWQGMTLRKLTFPARATKTLAVASEWGYSNFVCMCLQTQPKMELNQKLTKSLHRKRSIRGIYPRRKKKQSERREACGLGTVTFHMGACFCEFVVCIYISEKCRYSTCSPQLFLCHAKLYLSSN